MTTITLPNNVPNGYVLTQEGETLVLSGQFSEDLHARIKRIGGVWDGKNGSNRRVWLIPADKASSLKRIFSNAAKAADEAANAADRVKAVRWLEWVEDHASHGFSYENGFSKLEELKIGRWPDLQARRDAALERVRAAEQRREAERAAQVAVQKVAAKRRVLFPLSASPDMNSPVRWQGQVIVFTGSGQTFRISDDAPSMNGHHLLGHEGERGCYYYYRPATPEEIAELETAEKAEQQVNEEQSRRSELETIKAKIIETGDTPSIGGMPVGEKVVLSPATVYGTGEWFVITRKYCEAIWFVQANGMDGDDWSKNNLTGCIGWRIPYNEELATRLIGCHHDGRASS